MLKIEYQNLMFTDQGLNLASGNVKNPNQHICIDDIILTLANIEIDKYSQTLNILRPGTQPRQWKCPAISPGWLLEVMAFISTRFVLSISLSCLINIHTNINININIIINITGLTLGIHGFHIHQVYLINIYQYLINLLLISISPQLGDTSNGCASMAGHFNPFHVNY